MEQYSHDQVDYCQDDGNNFVVAHTFTSLHTEGSTAIVPNVSTCGVLFCQLTNDICKKIRVAFATHFLSVFQFQKC